MRINMPYKYIIIQPDGTLSCETHKKAPDWKEIQKYVGGTFQLVPYFSSMEYDGTKYNRGTAYCNENGYTEGLLPNLLASACWLKACPKGDPNRMHVVGPLLFVAKEKVHVEAS
jgi:hypothetical protein